MLHSNLVFETRSQRLGRCVAERMSFGHDIHELTASMGTHRRLGSSKFIIEEGSTNGDLSILEGLLTTNRSWGK